MTTFVVDSSALVAIILAEPNHQELVASLSMTNQYVVAAPTLVEVSMVLEGRLGPAAAMELSSLLRDLEVEILPFDERLAQRALDGWRRFGKGNHPAALNLGDCFTYALASELDAPVLCTGNDFAQTDVEVLRPAT